MDDIRHNLPAEPTRFIDGLRLPIRESGLAYRTEQTYIHWIKKKVENEGVGLLDSCEISSFFQPRAQFDFTPLENRAAALHDYLTRWKGWTTAGLGGLTLRGAFPATYA